MIWVVGGIDIVFAVVREEGLDRETKGIAGSAFLIVECELSEDSEGGVESEVVEKVSVE